MIGVQPVFMAFNQSNLFWGFFLHEKTHSIFIGELTLTLGGLAVTPLPNTPVILFQ